jgi:hypothetical protein
VWTSDRRALAVAAPIAIAAAAVGFECAAPPQCLRHSDCDDGLSCISGICAVDTGGVAPVEAGALVDATQPSSDATPPSLDATTSADARADGDASSDAGLEGGEDEDAPAQEETDAGEADDAPAD